MPSKPEPRPDQPDRLSVLTWNLALLESSAEAPLTWTVDHTEGMVRQALLAASPDVVAFQELPGLVPFVETHAMMRANPRSHSGNLATLVKSPLLAMDPSVNFVAGCAVLTTFEPLDLTIANVHLAPGPGGAPARLEQLAAIVEASPTEALVIIGDTNTRVQELPALADAGLLSDTPPRPTWDSKRNHFRRDGAAFTAYFTRWFASPGLSVTGVRVLDQPLEVDGHRFHLSDHYPLRVVVEVPQRHRA